MLKTENGRLRGQVQQAGLNKNGYEEALESYRRKIAQLQTQISDGVRFFLQDIVKLKEDRSEERQTLQDELSALQLEKSQAHELH